MGVDFLSSDYINDEALSLINTYGTRDPFEIARQLGIKIYLRNDFKRLKGMYMVILRNRCIFINNNLCREAQRILCAHELGHDILHRELAKSKALQEFVLYDMKSRPEYEANAFASELLLPDEEVCQYLIDGYDVVQIAGIMNTDINLLLIKMAQLNKRGHNFKTPYMPSGDFIGKI